MEKTLHQLELWRKAKGLSRANLGSKIGVTAMTIRRYERGRVPGDKPRMPPLDDLNRLVLLTGGEVSANDWLGKEAADVVAKRQPAA